jgi:hypothetical protein
MPGSPQTQSPLETKVVGGLRYCKSHRFAADDRRVSDDVDTPVPFFTCHADQANFAHPVPTLAYSEGIGGVQTEWDQRWPILHAEMGVLWANSVH